MLQTFAEAMHNKHAQSVITDGDKAMHKSIQVVFPYAYHRLCNWHIERNAQEKLHDANMVNAFLDCIMGEYTADEFELWWRRMIDQFRLQQNE